MQTFSPAYLRRLGEAVFIALGTPADAAAIVADSLVGGSLSGHDSHGLQLLPYYARSARNGVVKAGAQPEVTSRSGATATIDGGWGWGQPAARLATRTAMDLASDYGIGAVTIQHCHHIGRVGEYPEIMAAGGMTGIVLCNSGPGTVPFGGREKKLGTNPIAWAAPTSNPEQPLLLDIATSSVAAGKVAVARAKGIKAMAPGLLVDANGNPTTAPDDYFAGGALLPMAGHKGFGLGTMVEILGGALSGGSPSCLPEYFDGNGPLFIAFKIGAFVPYDRFVRQVDAYGVEIKATRPAEGVDEVLLPGEPEARARKARSVDGIPLADATWRAICDVAADCGVALGEPTNG